MDTYKKPDVSTEDDVFYFLFNDEESDNNNRNKPCMVRWKSGGRVDPRLLTTLESFKEIYDKRREMFKKIFSEMYNEFVDVFNKLGEMMEMNKEARSMEQSTTLQRSLSFGSPRASSRGIVIDDGFFVDEKFKVRSPAATVIIDEKFKVRPPPVIIRGSDDKGGQTGQGDGK